MHNVKLRFLLMWEGLHIAHQSDIFTSLYLIVINIEVALPLFTYFVQSWHKLMKFNSRMIKLLLLECYEWICG